jgi:radical SAM superfamily enzyme YgiQ (UPF0313 family)
MRKIDIVSHRLLIIQPSHYKSRSDLSVHKSRRRSLVGLTLPYLAALTPREWTVDLIDEQLFPIDFDAPADLVALTTWTINSLRAYAIADRFRQRGVPVIMGGPHTFSYAEEAAEHCDGVGIGEGEAIWPIMLRDAAAGRLKKFYQAGQMQDLTGLPPARCDLLDLRRYGPIKTYSIQSSRGCPNRCDFCSERLYLGSGYRFRPIADVVAEIKERKAGHIFFADSNFAGKPSHTMALMEALIPQKVRWSALFPAYLCNDGRFLDLAKKSGLLHVNIGMESIDQETLAGLGKRCNDARQYRDILFNLRKRGISHSLNFIFGWDTDKEDVFSSTLAFLNREKVSAAYFNILTPHKGTPMYERMLAENRIIDVEHIGRWPGIRCHIKPAYCSTAELERRVREMYFRFYSYPSILSRLPLPLTQADIASWVINFSQRKISRATVGAENFDNY